MSAQISRGEGNQKASASTAGAAGASTATIAQAAGRRTVVTYISGSGDAAALVTLESPLGTVLWRRRYTAAFVFGENFAFGEYEAVDGQDIVLKISAATAASELNIAGLRAGL